MTRILLLAALALFVIVAVRRALLASRTRPSAPRRRVRGSSMPPARSEEAGPDSQAPEFLVCGACGHGFDPEESGWICPRCGK